jgi:ankyrin repeat protein
MLNYSLLRKSMIRKIILCIFIPFFCHGMSVLNLGKVLFEKETFENKVKELCRQIDSHCCSEHSSELNKFLNSQDIAALKNDAEKVLIELGSLKDHNDCLFYFLKCLLLRDTDLSGKINELFYDALESGDLPRIQLFLEAGVKGNFKEKEWLPILLAARKGHSDIVRLLFISGEDLSARRLHCTYYGSRILVMENSVNALFYAARNGHSECLKWLLRNGLRCEANEIPLMCAAAVHGDPEVLKILIKAGQDVNQLTHKGLRVKEQQKFSEISVFDHFNFDPFISQGIISRNSRLEYNHTPLHLAVFMGNLDAIKLLIEAGADPNMRSSRGRTPLHLNLRFPEPLEPDNYNSDDFVRRLSLSQSSSYLPPLDALEKRPECLRYLVQAGADSSLADDRDRTPLHLLLKRNNYECVKALLESGIKVDDRAINELEPVHKAVEEGNDLMLNLLIDAGLDINRKPATKNEISPLSLALSLKNLSAIKILLKAGAFTPNILFNSVLDTNDLPIIEEFFTRFFKFYRPYKDSVKKAQNNILDYIVVFKNAGLPYESIINILTQEEQLRDQLYTLFFHQLNRRESSIKNSVVKRIFVSYLRGYIQEFFYREIVSRTIKYCELRDLNLLPQEIDWIIDDENKAAVLQWIKSGFDQALLE